MAIHWYSPAVALCMLLAGIMFAIGHHLFYQGLDGCETPAGSFSLGFAEYSRQQAIIQGGTALAFLTHLCLTTSVFVSYAQLFWRSALHQKSQTGITLGYLDVLFGVTRNPLLLFRPRVWRNHVTKLVMALVIWLLPIGSIITPATLSVVSTSVTPIPSEEIYMPELNYTNLAMTADLVSSGYHFAIEDGKNDVYRYSGPSQAVARVANAVASTGSISALNRPATNATWSQTFFAPTLQCNSMDKLSAKPLAAAIDTYNFNRPNCVQPYGYLAWTSAGSPFSSGSNSSLKTVLPLSPANNISELYIATLPGMWQTENLPSHVQAATCQALFLAYANDTDPMGTFGVNATFTRCRMHNASYHLHFSFINGLQEVDLDIQDIQQTPLSVVESVYGPASFLPPNCSVLNMDNRQCVFDIQTARDISYQSIMEAFNTLIIGSIQKDFEPGMTAGKLLLNTRVLDSVLVNSPEMSFLRDRAPPEDYEFSSLQRHLAKYDKTILDDPTVTTSQPLPQTLEALFQNITISLMSCESMLSSQQANGSESPSLTTVSLPAWHNIYIYNKQTLWVVYGLSIALTIPCVVIAMTTMLRSGASYSSDFSTIFRTAHFAYLPNAMEQDADGQDPLPKRLADARVLFEHRDYGIGLDLHSVHETSRTDMHVEYPDDLQAQLVLLSRSTEVD